VTEKLYDADPALLSFDARVLAVSEDEGRCEVELDRTCFYPGGGGQPHDTGTLGASRVVETGYREDRIVHVVEPVVLPAALGATLHGVVDADRRHDYMAQHTGQHIFSQALVRAGGLETVSVHFGEDETTIELKTDTVNEKTLRAAEDTANAVIRENRPVLLHEIDPSEVSRFPLRRTPPDVGRLRIVEVKDFDFAACGGIHVASTGEVFLAKAVSVEKIRGRARVHVMIGRRAFDDYGRKTALLQWLSKELTCGEPVLRERVQELLAREKEASRELRRLRVAQAATDADDAVSTALRVGAALCVRRVFEAAGPEYLKAFAERVVAVPGRVVIALDRGAEGFQWIVAHSLAESLDLAGVLPGLLEAAQAKGGGRGSRMQGMGARAESAAPFADAIEAALARRLG
jgi:alanyl-tRNA synthetase